MTDEYVPKFEPGEVAVLLHNLGGRLFVVGRVPERIVPGEHYRVFEQKTREWHGDHDVSTAYLVKVKDGEAAVSLVAQLQLLQDLHDKKARELQYELDCQRRAVVAQHSMEFRTEED